MGSVILLALTSQPALAWSHTGKFWDRDDLPVEWHLAHTVDDTIDRDYVDDAIAASFDTWVRDAPCAQLSHEYQGERSDTDGGFESSDLLHTFSFEDPLDQLDGGTLAATLCDRLNTPSYTLEGKSYYRTTDCDIVYNESVPWGEFDDIEDGNCAGEYSLQAVSTHEIGHLWGLGHSCNHPDDDGVKGDEACDDPDLRYATMYWQSGSCDNYQGGELRSDDVDGINSLYGPYCTFEPTEDTPTEGGAPMEVCFEYSCNELPENVTWDFGDGSTSENLDESCHTYDSKGQFTVSLTSSGTGDECGEWSTTKRERALVLVCGEPEPAEGFDGLFTYEHSDGLIYQLINQTDTSVYGCIDQIQWDVYKGASASGDPIQTISAWSPKVEFESEGKYTVVLNVGGAGGVSAGELTFSVEDKPAEGSGKCSAVPLSAGIAGVLIGLGAAIRRRRS